MCYLALRLCEVVFAWVRREPGFGQDVIIFDSFWLVLGDLSHSDVMVMFLDHIDTF